MKNLKIVTSAIIAIALAGSCKKDNGDVVMNKEPQLSKIEQVGTSWSTEFSYGADGRIQQSKDNSFTTKFDYSSGSPVIYEYNTATGLPSGKIAGVVMNNERIAKLVNYYYNSTGAEVSSTPFLFEYDVNGYQVKKSYDNYVYSSTVVNGNTIKLLKTNTSTGVVNTTDYEYFLDKKNLFNLNFLEQWWFDNVTNDKSLMGTKNENLLKKATTTAGANTTVTEFTYTFDASGKVTDMSYTTTVNGGTPVTNSFKMYYR